MALQITSPPPPPTCPPELYHRVRSHFSYFDPHRKNPVFFENAGGSQVPLTVIEAVREHMLDHYVQLGAGYELSERATSTVDAAHDVIKTFLNVADSGEVVLGGSTSQLLATIADAYRGSGTVRPGDEVIIHGACHEANVGPWVRLADDTGAKLKWWPVDPKPPHSSNIEELDGLLTERTRIVALTHVSNILGEILDVQRIVRMVRGSLAGPRARVVFDGVAYAPHRIADVSKWGVDWYAFSVYKTWGPHVAALYGSHDAFRELEGFGPNHYWIDGADVPYKFELGGPSHEACAGILGLAQYIASVARESRALEGGEALDGEVRGGGKILGGNSGDIEEVEKNAGDGSSSFVQVDKRPKGTWEGLEGAASSLASKSAIGKLDLEAKRGLLARSEVEAFFQAVTWMEQAPQEKLLQFLLSRSDLTVVGPATWQPEVRVPTFSFVHQRKSSAEITRALQRAGFAMRHGHMYARRLMESLGILDVDDGVVRISLLHYNTPDEVDRLIVTLDEILPPLE